jgi:hypothetical protein
VNGHFRGKSSYGIDNWSYTWVEPSNVEVMDLTLCDEIIWKEKCFRSSACVFGKECLINVGSA